MSQGHLSTFTLLCNYNYILLQNLFIFFVHHWNHIPVKYKLSYLPQPLGTTILLSVSMNLLLCVHAQWWKNLPALQETWVQSLGREEPLEKDVVTYPSILAWRIPWAVKPGGLQSVGSVTNRTRTCTCTGIHMCSVTQSCPTLCNPMDCNPPGSSVYGIF